MALAAFGMAFTSCSSDEPMGGGDGSGKITFTAQLPAELGSRAFSDGNAANSLSYYVYKTRRKRSPDNRHNIYQSHNIGVTRPRQR